MTLSRLKSACLAAGVHGVALLLAWAGWQGVQSAPQAGQGLQVTTLALAPAPDAAEAKPRDLPEQARVAETPEDPPRVMAAISSPVHPSLPDADLAKPVMIADAGSPGHAQHSDEAMDAPIASSTHEPQGAASAPPGEAAPIKSASTYAIRVFRHIRDVKDFPARLAQTGMRGRVLIRFNITPSGEATNIAIALSSGVAALDALALEQIRAAIPYPLPPRELPATQRQFIVPMTYRPSS